jgi:hypothetical protein
VHPEDDEARGQKRVVFGKMGEAGIESGEKGRESAPRGLAFHTADFSIQFKGEPTLHRAPDPILPANDLSCPGPNFKKAEVLA